jgi:hypothetical protein
MQPACAPSAIPGEIRRAEYIVGEGVGASIACAALYEPKAPRRHGRRVA